MEGDHIESLSMRFVFCQTLKILKSDFVIATLNIQSTNAKFDNLNAIIKNLSASGQYFGAICPEEAWFTFDADMTLFEIPGYKLIHQVSRCTRHVV